MIRVVLLVCCAHVEAVAVESAASADNWLDVTLCVVLGDDWDEASGGYLSYLTYDEPLLTVLAAANTLSIVQRSVSKHAHSC